MQIVVFLMWRLRFLSFTFPLSTTVRAFACTHARTRYILILSLSNKRHRFFADTDLQSISNYGVDINHNSNEIAAKHGATQVKTQVERVGKEKRNDAQINRENATVKHKSVENPLKKYAPVSVPGWEVNIIYKPSRKNNYSVPANTSITSKAPPEVPANTSEVIESSDVARLIDDMDGSKDVRGGASETKEARSVFWKPVTAVQKLMKRVRGTGRN